MVTDAQIRDRWLKDAQPYAPPGDWDPDEYYQWCIRLKEARNGLKSKCEHVDKSLIDHVGGIVDKLQFDFGSGQLEGPSLKQKAYCGRLIVRDTAAYNFFMRSSFDDLTEKQMVARVQKHLGKLEMGLDEMEIARLLQAAADKVPLQEAVKSLFAEQLKRFEDTWPILNTWGRKVRTTDEAGKGLVEKLFEFQKTNGRLPTVPDELYKILDAYAEEEFWWKGSNDEGKKLLATQENLDRFIALRTDPGLPTLYYYHMEFPVKALRQMYDDGTLDEILDKAATWEKNSLSWSKTIGPAVTAIRRLGRKSVGQDVNALAEYARNHAKPPS